MKLLIGNTGVIGKTLKDKIEFNYEFNSKNIDDLLNLEIDPSTTDLYLCCLPATKWLINKNPQADLDNIFSILNIITKKEYRNVILYSTIDVYNNAPLASDESYPIQASSPNYGYNRFLFEKLVSTTLKYQQLLILRLPALFGKHIKKNILFDLLNNNEVHKINYHSSYQWYNLEKLVNDTSHCLQHYQNKLTTINLFSEPVATSDILKIFNIDKSKVDTESDKIIYNFKTNSNPVGYINNKKTILSEIESLFIDSKLKNIKMAVCLFGEPRDILSRVEHWKKFKSQLSNVDFYLAFYDNGNIYDTIKSLREQLPVKSFFITSNDLDYFDKIKYQTSYPIYIWGGDSKATFARITSQAFIRQKAVSLVNLKDYDTIILCRSDTSNFAISNRDIINTTTTPDLLIVNSDTHIHPGGGSGCTKCNIDSKCDLEYHANDICDLWCVGSPMVMDKWNYFYNDLLKNYLVIQQTTLPLKDLAAKKRIHYEENMEKNEIKIIPKSSHTVIENEVHCFYPEKIMRSVFKDAKIVGATNDKKLWT